MEQDHAKGIGMKFKIKKSKKEYYLDSSIKPLDYYEESEGSAEPNKLSTKLALSTDETSLVLPYPITMLWHSTSFKFKTECASEMIIVNAFKLTCHKFSSERKLTKVVDFPESSEIAVRFIDGFEVLAIKWTKKNTYMDLIEANVVHKNDIINSLSVTGKIVWNRFRIDYGQSLNIPYQIHGRNYRFVCDTYLPGDELPDLPLNMECKLRGMEYRDFSITILNQPVELGIPHFEKIKMQIVKRAQGYYLNTGVLKKFVKLEVVGNKLKLKFPLDFPLESSRYVTAFSERIWLLNLKCLNTDLE